MSVQLVLPAVAVARINNLPGVFRQSNIGIATPDDVFVIPADNRTSILVAQDEYYWLRHVMLGRYLETVLTDVPWVFVFRCYYEILGIRHPDYADPPTGTRPGLDHIRSDGSREVWSYDPLSGPEPPGFTLSRDFDGPPARGPARHLTIHAGIYRDTAPWLEHPWLCQDYFEGELREYERRRGRCPAWLN